MITTLTTLFATLFDRDELLRRARAVKALVRLKQLHPADVLLSVIRSALAEEHPSIATARRQYHGLTGYMPEESSFYERLTPGMGDLGWALFLERLSLATRVQRQLVAKALGLPVRDVRAVDATHVTLPRRAAAQFPSTHSKLGGFKITATLSVLEDLLIAAHVTDARQHDRKAFRLGRDLERVLHLMDRGYADHQLFADIADGKGLFIIRLKSCSRPVIERIRGGLSDAHVGAHLDRTLPFDEVVDLDARFRVGRSQRRTFRVVGIATARRNAGRPDRVWLATNLPAHVPAQTVGTFYRLRWLIENLFRVLKSVGRLDSLPSGNPAIIKLFIAATLLGLVLTQCICALMRRECPGREPSAIRVFALLLAALDRLAAAYGTPRFPGEILRFAASLFREGTCPNPGRPYARERYLFTVDE